MKDSSDILIHEIIDDYQCPFTASEVHGFYTGLVLSNISNIDLDKKVLAFMDIDEGSLSKSRKLTKSIQNELKSSNLDIQAGEEGDYKLMASSLAELVVYIKGDTSVVEKEGTNVCSMFANCSGLIPLS